MDRQILTGARIFDGQSLHVGLSLLIEAGRIGAIGPRTTLPDAPVLALPGGVLAPGLIDLQVNGGGGVMLDGAANPEQIATICAAHARLGTTGLLPTLITDTPQATRAVLAAGVASVGRVPGLLGLHLEGPHLDPRRHGAHDPALIRPLDQDDIELYCEARAGLPALMITLAPASATPEQIATLVRAGIVVSLGHAECSFEEAHVAQRAGAAMVTHLFNAMSQMQSRAPGLVGAALALPLAAGLIADGIHVHPETLRIALAAKPAGEMFLVTDAMACAGTAMTEFTLGGRRILRSENALRLENGTLAGADLALPQAIKLMIEQVGISPERALAMATRIPADLIGAEAGRLAPGAPADLVHLSDDWMLRSIWRGGVPVQAKSATA
ncbi:N-acetylglucosamine-6-phosphate deacetylase [Pseudothioclava arenosa]|uniref:N-acetylglucosamine-6-phosphate deacetylase n=1 Tax=Pseudothioclava arenosa TaxID=1795308 RepID=A0A2A4CMR0_9RHOB|nr:N-acetylglucosamine-6-phosphate deacetylase [Pseudothioclava arenosa]PCD76531.1 N-acetylglucosamine-6-phosphate deacetylase [Pseudothioclava arenosa]